MNWFRRTRPSSGDAVHLSVLSPDRATYQALSESDMQADQDALERGQLPTRVTNRILATSAGERPWLSTLDIADLYFAEGLRITPVGHVTGSAYYHVATDMQGREFLDGNSDATNLIRGYYAARDIAVERLTEETKLAEGHAVVDAQFKIRREGRIIEVSVVGTAIRWADVRSGRLVPVSPLSGEEFFKLANIGWLPVGFSLGYHWHVMPVGYRTRQVSVSSFGQNQELSGVSERLGRTREVAVRALRHDAARTGAHGVAGVRFETRIEETEILFSGGFPGQYLRIDDTNYIYEDNGTVEVPAFNLEFYATGAAIHKISQGRLTPDAIAHFLNTV